MDPDTKKLLDDLRDLHRQATVERSHYYSGKLIKEAIETIERLELNLMSRDGFIGSKGLWNDFVAQLPR